MRRILACAIVVALAAPAGAQLNMLKKTTPEERASVLTDLMRMKLGLSDDQLAQVSEVNLKYAKKMQPIIEGSDTSFREIWEMREANEGKEDELRKLLTPKQFQRYLDEKSDLRDQFEARLKQQVDGHR